MAIISSILVLVAVIYSWAFMKENTGLDRYYTLILLLTAGMLGMVLTGDMLSAAEAERLGLINKVVPADQLEEATIELAEKLAAKSPLALQIGKTGIYGMQDLPYHQALDYLGELFAALCSTADAEEGVEAFLQKRKPVWQQR